MRVEIVREWSLLNAWREKSFQPVMKNSRLSEPSFKQLHQASCCMPVVARAGATAQAAARAGTATSRADLGSKHCCRYYTSQQPVWNRPSIKSADVGAMTVDRIFARRLRRYIYRKFSRYLQGTFRAFALGILLVFTRLGIDVGIDRRRQSGSHVEY